MSSRKLRALILLASLLTLAVFCASAAPVGRDVTSLLSDFQIVVLQNGVEIQEGDEVTTDPIKVVGSFGIPVMGDDPPPADPILKGDYAIIPLAEGLKLANGPVTLTLNDGPVVVGHVQLYEEIVGGVTRTFARVDFDGDDDVYNGDSFAVSAFFSADFEYDGTGTSDGTGNETFVIMGKTYTVSVPPGEIFYALNKTGVADFENRVINWTAVVNAHKDGLPYSLGGHEFIDDLNNPGTYVPGSFAVSGIASPIPTVAGGVLRYTFPAATLGPRTITYQTRIPDSLYYSGAPVTVHNDATLENPSNTVVGFDSADVGFNPGWIEKTGQAAGEGGAVYDPVGRTITWTIIANTRDLTLQNVVITESMPPELIWQEAYWQTWDGVTAGPPVTFAAEPAGGVYPIGNINSQIRLVIVTGVPDEAYEAAYTVYTNYGSIGFDGAGVPATGIGTGGVGVGIGFVPIGKSGSPNLEDGTIRWTVNVDPRGQTIPDLRVYDLLVHGTAPVTDPQIPTGVTPRYNQSYIPGTDSVDPGLTFVHTPILSGGDHVADLITVTGFGASPRSFRFSTQIEDPRIYAGNERANVLNTAFLYSGSTQLNFATATVPYSSMVLRKTMLTRDAALDPLANANSATNNLADGFNYVDKSVVFRISVNANNMDFTAAMDENGVTPGTVTISDTLPAGWEYAPVIPGSDYLLLEGIGASSSGEVLADSPPVQATPAGFTANVAGSSATFTFTQLDRRYVILVRARPTAATAAVLFNNNKTTFVDNTAAMTTQNWAGYSISSTQRVRIDSLLLSKTANRPTNGEVIWSLEYKPYLIGNVVPPGSSAVVTDVIPEGVELRMTSGGALIIPGNITATVLNLQPDGSYTAGAPLPLTPAILSYDNATRELEFTIPDPAIAYRFTYVTDVTGDPGTVVTNDATLLGKSVTPTQTEVSFLISTADAGASLNKGGLIQYIYKYGSLGRPQGGVQFTLFAMDGTTVIRRATSHPVTGRISMRSIPIGSYILKETSVPAGYTLDPTEHSVVVSIVGTKVVTSIDGGTPMPNGTDGGASLTVRNITEERLPISALKLWNGGFHTSRVAPVFTLIATYNGVSYEIPNDIIPPVIEKVGDTFKYTWPDMPVKSDDGYTIAYSVVEKTTPAGYVQLPEVPNAPLSVTNTYRFTATKTWQNGRWAPKDAIWFKLYRQAGTGAPVLPVDVPEQQIPTPYPTTGNTQTITINWDGLDAEAVDGTDYIYSVVEGTLSGGVFTPGTPANFTKTENGLAITNSYVIPKTTATATKQWVGRDTPRPTVWFRLQRRTIAGAPGTWGAAGAWGNVPGAVVKELLDGTLSVTWTDLDATTLQGIPYEFRVIELNAAGDPVAPPNYTKYDQSLNVINRYTVFAAKLWVNGRWAPKTGLAFRLYRSLPGGTPLPVPGINPITLPAPTYADGVYNATVNVNWQNIDAEDEFAVDYVFTVREGTWNGTNPDSFVESPQQNFNMVPLGTQVTNSYNIPEDATVTVTKQWQYGATARPGIWVTLQRRTIAGAWGSAGAWDYFGLAPQYLPDGTTTATWTALERTDIQGRIYEFRVREGTYNPGTNTFTEGAPQYYERFYSDATPHIVRNEYRASGSIDISTLVSKRLEGRPLKPNEFTFTLHQILPAPTPPAANPIQTVKNTAAGAIPFTALSFNQTHIGLTFQYEIRETAGSETGMTYDLAVRRFNVLVEDAGAGQLRLTLTPVHTGTDPVTPFDPTFDNAYTASGTIQLGASKSRDLGAGARSVQPGEFRFELRNITNPAAPVVLETNVGNDAAGNVAFSHILYTQADIGKTYFYDIREIPGSEAGMTYDTLQVIYQVTVTDLGNGHLRMTATTPPDQVFNNLYRASGSLDISALVTKSAPGMTLMGGEFTFALFREPDLTTPIKPPVSNAAGGAIPFGTLTFTQADIGQTYTYRIREVVPVPPAGGVTYDPLEKVFTVQVTDGRGGTLSFKLTPPANTVFGNRYESLPASLTLQVSKALSGRALTVDEFTFAVYQTDSTYTVASGAAPVRIAKNGPGGVVQFLPAFTYADDNLTSATNSKTYYYVIREISPLPPGTALNPADQEIRVSVVASDNGAGQMVATPVYPADVTFNNDYTAKDTSVILSASKALTGRALQDGEFTFTLTETDSDFAPLPGGHTQTVPNVGTAVTFAPIPYTDQDTTSGNNVSIYYYVIRENPGSLGGVAYDGKPIQVTVTVTDKGDGTMTATPSYSDLTPFANDYTAKDTSVILSASKALTGRALQDGEFTFTLTETDNTFAPLPGGHTQTVPNVGTTVTFAPIPYTDQDVDEGDNISLYYYTITENVPDPALGGISYDPMVIRITVTVTDNGKGQLEVLDAYETPDKTFNNDYRARDAKVALEVAKALTGRAQDSGEFTFELFAANGVYEIQGAAIQTAANTAAGVVTFLPIAYSDQDPAAGNNVSYYYYVIREVAGLRGGVTYNTQNQVVNALVIITDVGDGQLKSSVVYSADKEFNNSYKAEDTEAFLSVTKALTGRDLEADEFTFTLCETESDFTTVIRDVETRPNDALGSVNFLAIPYTDQDATVGGNVSTYYYTVTENAGSLGGVTYDTMVANVTVTVTDNNEGELVAVVTYTSQDTEFNNSYKAEPVDASFAATKELSGQDIATRDFTFELFQTDSAFVPVGPALETVTNDDAGAITFSTITYTDQDVTVGDNVSSYYYVIREVPGTETGMEYNTEGLEIKVIVTVTDNGEGQLVQQTEYVGGDTSFHNRYTADGEITLAVTKSLDLGAGGRTVEEGEFFFNLYLGTDTGVMPIQTKSNAADGTVTFNTIYYTQDDIGQTYVYTILEIPSAELGMTSDPMLVTVSVTVTDETNGVLLATPEYSGDTEFNNSYAANGAVALSVAKELSGRPMADDEFTFQLWQLDGPGGERTTQDPIQTATNTAAGQVQFSDIPATQEDIGETWYFEVVEVQGTDPTIIYDTLVIEVAVDITDMGNGTINAIPAYTQDTVFNNVYDRPGPTPPPYEGIRVPLELEKVLEGRALTEGEFEFILRDGSDNVIARVSNDASGVVRFPSRYYSRPGLYLYEITEVRGTDASVAYDETTYGVRVNVSAQATTTGEVLSASVTWLKNGVPFGGALQFTNTYEPPDTGDAQPTLIILLAVSSMLVLLLALTLRDRKRAPGAGK